MALNLPALAQRVTVLGSTRNIAATSAGVRRVSVSELCCILGTSSGSVLLNDMTSMTLAGTCVKQTKRTSPSRSRPRNKSGRPRVTQAVIDRKGPDQILFGADPANRGTPGKRRVSRARTWASSPPSLRTRRSEERRVGKECQVRRAPEDEKKK